MYQRKKDILKLLSNKPNSTYADIAKYLNVPLCGVIFRHVKELVDEGYLRRQNRWSLSPKAKLILKEREWN